MSAFQYAFQSEIDDFVRKRHPIAFKAKGNPLHSLTILLPIFFNSSFNSRLSSFDACFAKPF